MLIRSPRPRRCSSRSISCWRKPTEQNLLAARAAWIAARMPYMQTEAFRFGNSIVDDWEGKVNSWPLDEGLIDYVAGAYGTDSPENELYAADVIANASLTIGGKKIDTSKITKELLADKLQEAGGVEANVATGYHAVEFLLWGQDLNGTGPGAGNRPATDFNTKKCTGGHCDRRAQYLRAVTDLLVDDLAWMTAQWGPGGEARKTSDGRHRRGGPDRDPHRARQPVLWRACRRAHEARPHDPRSRGGARLLLRQHLRLALFRRARHPQCLCSAATAGSMAPWCRARASPTWSRRSRRRLTRVRAKLDATMDAMSALYRRGIMIES